MNAELIERECDEFRCSRKALLGRAYCGWHSEQEPRPDEATSTQADEDEAYDIGKRDGYEKAVQDIDLLTGGDGEYVASTLPERDCRDAESMKARIVERFEALSRRTADDEVTEAMIEAGKAVLYADHPATARDMVTETYLAMRHAAVARSDDEVTRLREALEELRDELLEEPQLLDIIDAALATPKPRDEED